MDHLAQLHADATRDLERHRPGDDGTCLGCGEEYLCPEGWINIRAIMGVEARWRQNAVTR